MKRKLKKGHMLLRRLEQKGFKETLSIKHVIVKTNLDAAQDA